MGNLWDNQYWEDEAELREIEAAHKTYTPDTPDLDIMETY